MDEEHSATHCSVTDAFARVYLFIQQTVIRHFLGEKERAQKILPSQV